MLLVAGKWYVFGYNNTTASNIVDFLDKLKFNSHEEAGTLIVLDAIDIAQSNPFSQLYIACSDTDVFLLLLYFYPHICNNTVFHTTTRDINIGYAFNTEHCVKSVRIRSYSGLYSVRMR